MTRIETKQHGALKPGKRPPGVDQPSAGELAGVPGGTQSPLWDLLLLVLTVAAIATVILCSSPANAQGAPEIDIQCPPGTSLSSGVTDTNWITMVDGGRGCYRTVRVLNAGTAPLDVSKPTCTAQTNCIPVMVNYQAPWRTTLAPGEWQEVDIGTGATSTGYWSMTYTVANNDPTGAESPFVFTFAGTFGSNPVGAVPALRVITEPIYDPSGPVFQRQPVVEVLDAAGNRETSFNGPVTVSLAGGAGANGQLNGTTTVNAVNGVATFTDLETALSDSLYSAYDLYFTAAGHADTNSWPTLLINFAANPGGSSPGSGSGGGGGGGCAASHGGSALALLSCFTLLLYLFRRRGSAQTSRRDSRWAAA